MKKKKPVPTPPKPPPEAMEKPGMGRKPSLTPSVHKRIVTAVTIGQSLTEAARAIPIDKSTASKWRERGRVALESWESLTEKARADELPYINFFNDLYTAEARGEQYDLTIIHNAKRKHWQAAAWMRERINAGRWAKRIRLAGDDELPPVSTSNMSKEDARARAKKLHEMLKASGQEIE